MDKIVEQERLRKPETTKPKGKPPKLDEDKWKGIRGIVDNKSPKDCYDTDFWDTKTIGIFIRDHYGVEYELRYIYHLS